MPLRLCGTPPATPPSAGRWVKRGSMLGFSAATFMRVATSDLLPVFHRQNSGKLLPSGVVILGPLFMAVFGWIGVG